jgi:hypothetical protein
MEIKDDDFYMDALSNKFNEFLRQGDTDKLNDLLIEWSNNPKDDYLKFIEALIYLKDLHIQNKLIINLVFLLGQIGQKIPIDSIFIEFLEESYYKSDKWVRAEILNALSIIRNVPLSSKLTQIVHYALGEEHPQSVLKALDLLSTIGTVSNEFDASLIKLINNPHPNVHLQCLKVLSRKVHSEGELFLLLNQENNYNYVQKIAFRSLIIQFCTQIVDAVRFKDRVMNANWNSEKKEEFLSELEIYIKILEKSL